MHRNLRNMPPRRPEVAVHASSVSTTVVCRPCVTKHGELISSTSQDTLIRSARTLKSAGVLTFSTTVAVVKSFSFASSASLR